MLFVFHGQILDKSWTNFVVKKSYLNWARRYTTYCIKLKPTTIYSVLVVPRCSVVYQLRFDKLLSKFQIQCKFCNLKV